MGGRLAIISIYIDDCLLIMANHNINKLKSIMYLCQFSTAYNLMHWNTIKHLLQYLKGTIDTTIKYKQPGGCIDPAQLTLTAYCNANHTGDIATHKSISVYLLQLAGGPIL
jgi:hypothetical protein